uniref:Protein TIC 214 n=1 Tax=Aldrovanda vesiculosa TaxID=173386 RepID=A0A1Z2RQY8_9CARY|nr:component of inner membrane protein import complex [Aldrovanda vesiculosa]ASA46291.1 component of inner membrane protein import complex [Aldrovanda vesiculosa]
MQFVLIPRLSLCMKWIKLINSVVFVGMFFGFLTAISIGPSYLLLFLVQVREKEIDKRSAAVSGVIMGQLIMQISIYYRPLHRVLGKPHILTLLILPYFFLRLIHNFHNFDFGVWEKPTSNITTGKRSIYYFISVYIGTLSSIFLNNLIFQLFNHYIYPNSTLFRLVNIYLFRYSNKVLFLVSSFFGWLIGHILFVKCVESELDRIQKRKNQFSFFRSTLLIQSDVRNLVSELKHRYFGSELIIHIDPIVRVMRLVLIWIWKNSFIRLITLIKSNKSLMREWKYLVSDFWFIVAEVESLLRFRVHETLVSVLVFIIVGQYLAKMPLPILTNTMYQAAEDQKQKDKERIERLKESGLYNEEEEKEYEFDEEEDEPKIYEKENEDNDYKGEIYAKLNEDNEDYIKIYEKLNEDNEDLDPSKTKKLFWDTFVGFFDEGKILEGPYLYDIYQWNRPVRYTNKNNKRWGQSVRNEMSQYYFYPCQNDGKQRLSFTYPPRFSIFWEIIQSKKFLDTITKSSCDPLNDYDYWISTIAEKRNRLTKELKNRIEVLDLGNESLYLNVLEKKNRLGKSVENESEFQEIYLKQEDDPLLKGPHRVPVITAEESTFTDTQPTSVNNSNEESISSFVEPIVKEVLKWKYRIYTQIQARDELHMRDRGVVPEIRSRKWFPMLLDTKEDLLRFVKDQSQFPASADDFFIYFSITDNYSRNLIYGTMRSQRRKVNLYNIYQIFPQSPLFRKRIRSWYREFISFGEILYQKLIEPFYIKKKFIILNLTEKETKHEEKKEKKTKEREIEKEQLSLEESRKKADEDEGREEQGLDKILLSFHPVRTYTLLGQSYLRKNVYLPFLIRIKNSIRLLLGQSSEWSEDKEDLDRETHILCTHSGFEYSDKELPKSWFVEGIQIKIVFPFRLRPWRDKSNLNLQSKNPKENFSFLTVFGTETYLPYSPRFIQRSTLFRPIFKELKKRIRKKFTRRNKLFTNLDKKTKKILKILIQKLNKITNRKINRYQILPKRIRDIEENSVSVIELRKNQGVEENRLLELRENQGVEENRLLELRENQGVEENRLLNLRENRFKNLTDKTRTILNEIEGMLTDKKTKARTKSIKLNIKRRGVRLIHKSHYLLQFFREKIKKDISLSIINTFFRKRKDIDMSLSLINFLNITTQAFLELERKIIDGYTFIYNEYFYNIKRDQKITQEKERINKRNKETIKFIWNIKDSLFFISELEKWKLKENRKITKNSKIFYDFSFLSQAYVFYKLSQNKVPRFYKLISILQNQGIFFVLNNDKQIKDYFQTHGISLFLKKEIKDYFRKQGIIQSQLKDKKFQNSIAQQWKNWLKSHYHHNLSTVEWSILAPEKWRNSITQYCRFKNSQLSKGVSYKKDRLIHYKKQKDSENYVLLLQNKNENFQKILRYDFLASQSIDYQEQKESHIYSSLTKNQQFYYIYNYYKPKKPKSIDICEGILITNYLGIGKDDIINLGKHRDRKFINFGILTLDLPIHQMQMKKTTFDYLVMKEKMLKGQKSNLKLWFFPEFVFFSNTYKKKAWVIKKDLLFENLIIIRNENEENENQEEKSRQIKMTKPSIKVIKEDGSKKGKKDIAKDSYIIDLYNEKEYEEIRKSTKPITIKSLQSRNIRYQYSLSNIFDDDEDTNDTNVPEELIDNIKTWALLGDSLTKKSRNFVLDTLKRNHLNLKLLISFDFESSIPLKSENEIASIFQMRQQEHKIIRYDSTLLESGILIAEPLAISLTDTGKLIMYQTLSLVAKSKDRHNQQKEIFDKKNFDESLPRYQEMMKKIEKSNHDLVSLENILSPRRRRELRILISLNSKKSNDGDKNLIFFNKNKVQIKNDSKLFAESEYLDKLIKLKLFLWPYYRLEDLACMNRYWFDTANGSRFSMLRIHLYPQL